MIEPSFDKNNFRELGFTIINNALFIEDLLRFRRALESIIRAVINKANKQFPKLFEIKPGTECDEGILALKNANPAFVSHVQRAISRSPEYYRLVSYPHLSHIFNELLDQDESPLYFSNNGVLFTQPYSGDDQRSINVELDWHNDIFYTIPRSQYLQMWAPLVHDATKEIGTLMICPGSHKHGLLKQHINTDVPYNHRYKAAPGIAEQFEQLSIELKLGQMLVFHHHLLHRSGRNISNKVRISMIGLCHNVVHEAFEPFTTEYKYIGQTPEAYFYESFGDEKAKEVMHEQAAFPGEPKGGV